MSQGKELALSNHLSGVAQAMMAPRTGSKEETRRNMCGAEGLSGHEMKIEDSQMEPLGWAVQEASPMTCGLDKELA